MKKHNITKNNFNITHELPYVIFTTIKDHPKTSLISGVGILGHSII